MAAFPLGTWRDLLPLFDAWLSLAPAQRHAALLLPARYERALPVFSGLPAAVDAVLFETQADGRKRPAPGLQRLIRFLHRLADWSLPEAVSLPRYVDLCTVYPQRYALAGLDRRTPQQVAAAAAIKALEDGACTRRLLDSQTRSGFLAAMGNWQPEGCELTEARFAALKAWVARSAAQTPSAFALRQETFPEARPSAEAADILFLALAYGAAYIGRIPDSLIPFVRVLPPKAGVSQDPARLQPSAFAARHSWTRPFLLDDMEALLRHLKADPAPLLSDGVNPPIAWLRKAAKTFAGLPFAPGPAGFPPESRARAAWSMLVDLKLLEGEGRGQKNWRAHPGARAAAWAAASRESRLADLLSLAPVGTRKQYPYHQRFAFLGDFEANPFPYAALSERLPEWLDAFFARLEKPAPWRETMGLACREANPFLADMEEDAELAGRWYRWEATPEETYAHLLIQYACRLAGLGALVVHEDGGGGIGLSLSPIGQWLYGRRDRWELPSAARKVAIVGGDHTVTLLEPAPDFVLELSAFAEPIPGTGNAYRITRRAVQAAAHAGLSADAMLKTLAAWARHALPGNVVHEVTAWAAGTAGVRLTEAVIVEGDDPLQVAEILAAFPKDFERLGPTALKAKTGGTRAALAKKLAKKGFFLA